MLIVFVGFSNLKIAVITNVGSEEKAFLFCLIQGILANIPTTRGNWKRGHINVYDYSFVCLDCSEISDLRNERNISIFIALMKTGQSYGTMSRQKVGSRNNRPKRENLAAPICLDSFWCLYTIPSLSTLGWTLSEMGSSDLLSDKIRSDVSL